MALVIIHGDDQVKTRNELQRIITQTKTQGVSDVVSLSGATITLETVMQSLESDSFFGDSNRLTILEGLHALKSKTTLTEVVDYLSKLDSGFVVLWESKELTATQLKKFPTAKVVTAKVPAVIFKLTDALVPNQLIPGIMPIYRAAVAADSAEMVLIMLARQVKMMIQSFDPASTLPPWQKAKLTKSAQGFGFDSLAKMYSDLTQIDVKNKTGQLPSNLESELAFWLATLYS